MNLQWCCHTLIIGTLLVVRGKVVAAAVVWAFGSASVGPHGGCCIAGTFHSPSHKLDEKGGVACTPTLYRLLPNTNLPDCCRGLPKERTLAAQSRRSVCDVNGTPMGTPQHAEAILICAYPAHLAHSTCHAGIDLYTMICAH